jgi:hypothetical protein
MARKSKRNNQYNGVATPFKQGSNYTLPYKDTIMGSLTITEEASIIDLGNQTLIPSIVSSSSTNTRLYVFRKIVVEVLPIAVDDQVVGQIQVGTGLTDGSPFGIAPFKIASQVNPTFYTMDFKKASRIAPYILRPVRGNTNINVLRLVFRGQVTTPQDTTVQFRVTSWIDVMPQDAPLDASTFFISTSSPSPPEVLSGEAECPEDKQSFCP